MTAFNSKWKYEKLAVRLIVRVCGHFAFLFCRGRLCTVPRFTEHTCMALFCSLNLLFGGAHWRRGLLQTPSTLRQRNLKTHTALFLRLGLRSRVIRHENGAFRKRFWSWRYLKTPAFSFRVDRKHFETDPFEDDRIRSGEPLDFPDFLKQKYKTTGDCCVFKLLQCCVHGRA